MNKAQEYFELNEFAKKLYKKFGEVLYRPATLNETVMTMVSGKLETMKQAEFGDVVVRNMVIGQSAEYYIIGGHEKFLSRYSVKEKFLNIEGTVWGVAEATGECEAVEYTGDEAFTFPAPWGEQMVCEPGDFLCKLPGEPTEKVYRIEREAFFGTYKS